MFEKEVTESINAFEQLKASEKALYAAVVKELTARFDSIEQLAELVAALPPGHQVADSINARIFALRTQAAFWQAVHGDRQHTGRPFTVLGSIGPAADTDIVITISGKAGSGKSTIVAILASVLGLDFKVFVDDRDGDFEKTLGTIEKRKDALKGKKIVIRESGQLPPLATSGPDWQLGTVLLLEAPDAHVPMRYKFNASVILQNTPQGPIILKNRWGPSNVVDADAYDDKLKHHPEQQSDEIFLGYYPEDAYRVGISWRKIRAGTIARADTGQPMKGLVPVFVKRDEVVERIAATAPADLAVGLWQKMLRTGWTQD